MSCAYSFVPIHMITVYIEPQNAKKAAKVISNLEHILALIFERLPSSSVILAGDFNEHKFKIDKICSFRRLAAVIPNGT